jgi:hypothetical protein
MILSFIVVCAAMAPQKGKFTENIGGEQET